MRYFVEVHVPRGPAERHELQLGSLTLGSGRTDSIRLGDSVGLGVSALRLEVRESHVAVFTTATSPGSISLHGVPQKEADVAWGDEVFLGAIRLSFGVEVTARSQARPWVLAGFAACALLGLGGLGLAVEPDDATDGDALEAPQLLASKLTCPEKESHRATNVARGALASAIAKEQRAPFSRSDGVEALRLYQEAAGCFRQGGDPDAAGQAGRSFERWSAVMAEDYSSLRLQLRVALQAEAHQDALASGRALETLLDAARVSPTDKYRTWLSALLRRLERRVSRL